MTDSQPEPPASPSPHPRPRRRVVFNVVFSILARAQGAVFIYLTTFILLRALKVEQYGLYSVLFVGTITNLGLLARLGLPVTLARFIPEFFTQSRFRMIVRLFWVTNLVQAGVGLALLSATFVLAPQIAVWTKFPEGAALIRVFAVGAYCYLLAENYRGLLGGLFMHNTIFWRNLVYNVIRLPVIFFATRMSRPLEMVILAETILYAVSWILFHFAYRKVVVPRVASDPHPDEPMPWKRVTRYTVLSYINEVGVMLLNWSTDLFLVTGFLGGIVVGMYGLANRILILLHTMLPGNFLNAVITPLFFSEYGASRERARFGFTLLCKISLLITIPMAVFMAVMARPVIVEFFDPRYAGAAGILVVMSAFLPMETLRYPVGLMLQNAERVDLLIYSKVFGVLKIAAGLWLVPRYGVMAMVWITSLSIASQNILSYIWIVRVLKSGTNLLDLAKMALNGVISAAVFYPMLPLFKGVVGVAAGAVVYSGLWIGINVLIKPFRREERDFINSRLPRPIWIF